MFEMAFEIIVVDTSGKGGFDQELAYSEVKTGEANPAHPVQGACCDTMHSDVCCLSVCLSVCPGDAEHREAWCHAVSQQSGSSHAVCCLSVCLGDAEHCLSVSRCV